jgi:hypothetical protein
MGIVAVTLKNRLNLRLIVYRNSHRDEVTAIAILACHNGLCQIFSGQKVDVTRAILGMVVNV